MKILGWICLIVGVPNLIGIVGHGDNILAGSFLTALGVFFLNKVRDKKSNGPKIG